MLTRIGFVALVAAFGTILGWLLSGTVVLGAGLPIVVHPNDYWYNHTFDAGPAPMDCSSVYRDSTHERQWYLDGSHMNTPRAWAISQGSSDVIIAIIDQDCDIWHYDLRDRIYQNYAELNGVDGVDDDGDGLVDNFWGWDFDENDNKVWRESSLASHHGTSMSGIIGATTNNESWWPSNDPSADDASPFRAGMAGITWNNKIYPIRGIFNAPLPGLNPPFSVFGGNATRALWHVASRVDLGDNIRVVNMSLRYHANNGRGENIFCPGDTTNYAFSVEAKYHLGYYRMRDAIDACLSRGVLVVAGAGNDDSGEDEIGMPCSYEPVLCASCVDALGARWDCGSDGGNWGESVDVCGYGSTKWNLDWQTNEFRDFSFPYDNPMSLGLAEDHLPLAWRFCGQTDYSDTTRVMAPTNMQTSGATAQAAGVAALVASTYPNLDAAQVGQMVKRGAVSVDSINEQNCGGPCEGLLGSGRLDAYRALTLWGTVARDTVLEGDVWMSGDVTVDPGVTLAFSPGCKVHVAPDNILDGTSKCALLVKGNLVVAGTAESPVEFSAWCVDRDDNNWDGIYVMSSAGSVNIEHLSCKNASYGVYLKIDGSLAHVSIDSCYNGLVLENCRSTIGPDISVSDTTGSGISVFGGAPLLTGVTVDRAGLHGIDVLRASVGSRIENSEITFSHGNGLKVTDSHLDVVDCIFSSSKNKSIYMDNSSVAAGGVEASSSPMGAHVSLSSAAIFRNCLFSRQQYGVNVDGTSSIDAGSSADFGDNEFDLISYYYAMNGNPNVTLGLVGNCFDGSTVPGPRKLVGLGPIAVFPGHCQ